MARVSTSQSYDSSLDQLIRRQSDLSDAQTRLTSGKRVMRGSDDPTAIARAERALAVTQRSEATRRSVQASQSSMSQTEGALADANEMLQQAREALVAAGNATYKDAERKSLAENLSSIRKQLLSVANRSDGGDGFLFSGQGSSLPPFRDVPGGVQFFGIGGQQLAAGIDGLPLTLDGGATWLTAPTGNGVFETRAVESTGGAWIDAGSVVDPAALTGSTYSVQFSVANGATTYSVMRDGAGTALSGVPYRSGNAISIDGMSFSISGAAADGDEFELRPSTPTLSVFDALDKAVSDLLTPGRSSAQIAQTNAENLRNIDAVMSRLQSARSMVGETLNNTELVDARLDSLALQGEVERTQAQDLDMVKAISDFQNKQAGYDAALKSYSLVQRMSLFQYISG